ncbi:hypothetical protein ACQX09_11660 [Corynebacterium diphtheriae]
MRDIAACSTIRDASLPAPLTKHNDFAVCLGFLTDQSNRIKYHEFVRVCVGHRVKNLQIIPRKVLACGAGVMEVTDVHHCCVWVFFFEVFGGFCAAGYEVDHGVSFVGSGVRLMAMWHPGGVPLGV